MCKSDPSKHREPAQHVPHTIPGQRPPKRSGSAHPRSNAAGVPAPSAPKSDPSIALKLALKHVLMSAQSDPQNKTVFFVGVPPNERRIGCIDGLRGYLALSVLIHHFIIWMQVTRLGGVWEVPSVRLFNQLGAGAVALFFMTTGLVFHPRGLAGFRVCSWPAIYTTRLFRIMPLVIVSGGRHLDHRNPHRPRPRQGFPPGCRELGRDLVFGWRGAIATWLPR